MDQAQVIDIITSPKNFSGLANWKPTSSTPSGSAPDNPKPTEMVSFAYTQRYCDPVGLVSPNTVSTGKWRKLVTESVEQIFNVASGNAALSQTLLGTATGSTTAAPLVLPPYSIVLCAALTYDSAVTLGTAVKLGIGTTPGTAGSGTDSNILLSGTAVTANTQYAGWPTQLNSANTGAGAYVNANSATSAALYLNACATGGGGTGTWYGIVRVNLIYQYMQLPAII